MTSEGTAGAALATCVDVGVFEGALTWGEQYAVEARDADKGQTRVRGDDGRTRWFPDHCFDLSGRPVLRRVRTYLDDPIEDAQDFPLDVVLEFADGQRRWCSFATPQMIASFGGTRFGDERLLSFGCPQLIVVTAITEAIIEKSLDYIESHGQLFDSSRAAGAD
ncbi:hypothetical protein BH10ACT9_BH10ACT9_43670 [soil metagenome]